MVEKILNNTTPYGKNRASHEGLLHSSTLIDNPNEIANSFNNYFANVGPDLARKITQPQNVEIYQFMDTSNVNSMFLNTIEDREILDIVKNFKSKMSTDTYNIDMTIVKNTIPQIVKPLIYLLTNLLKLVNFQI